MSGSARGAGLRPGRWSVAAAVARRLEHEMWHQWKDAIARDRDHDDHSDVGQGDPSEPDR